MVLLDVAAEGKLPPDVSGTVPRRAVLPAAALPREAIGACAKANQLAPHHWHVRR